MATEVSICNSALAKIGQPAITALDDGSSAADACLVQYETLRDYLLRLHPWNFATSRAALARRSEAPAFGFSYAYQLPSDWKRTLGIWDNANERGRIAYRLEGRAVLTDAEAVYLKYTATVTDPNAMPDDFREALAYLLAAELATSIAQSGLLSEKLREQFLRVVLPKAMAADSSEDAHDEIPDPPWVTDRNR